MRRSSREEHGQSHLLQHYVRTAGAGVSRRRAQRTLGAARIEAEMANRAKSDFLANLSHELRTPLNAIIGFADVLARGVAGEETTKSKEYGAYIATAGRHLLTVLSDILDMAQIDGGRFEVELSRCDLRTVLEQSVSCLKERVGAKHQLMSLLIDDDLPSLRADPRRLQQAVVNLLTNASKYTHEGGCITVRCLHAPGGGVATVVTDNGKGMTEDQLRRALAPFTHLQAAYAAAGEPMTLGLAISKRLIELQGGSFSIQSAPGEGTQAEIQFGPASFAETTGAEGRHE